MMAEIDGAVDKLLFFVNGRKVKKARLSHACVTHCTQVILKCPDPEMTLLYFLRNHRKFNVLINLCVLYSYTLTAYN